LSYKHGVSISEVPTSILPPVEVSAGLPVFVGRAPINLTGSSEYVNKPLLAYSYEEAVKALGYTSDFENYELCEAIKVMFQLFAVSPIVFINVLDPAVHKKTEANKTVNITAGEVILNQQGVLLESLLVKKTSAGQSLQLNTDYAAAFNDAGQVLITVLDGGAIDESQTTLVVSYNYIDPTMVTEQDIIGGVSATTGKLTGMELINRIFPLFRLVPGQVLSPGWSQSPMIAAIMKAKVQNINGLFKAMALCDLDSSEDGADLYSEAPAWKENNNYTDKLQINCWPLVKLSDEIYHLSTQLAGVICRTDADNNDIPYVSPSNHSLQVNGAVTKSGEEVSLGPEEAAYLNGQGIVTALNFIGGWKAWGNRTGVFPGGTDPKDSWIPVRRMFNWIGNELILTYWQKVDDPTNKRLILTVVDSFNIRLNGLTAKGALLGGRVEFQDAENPKTDLMNGKVRFHIYQTPPTPAEDIEFILEFDTTYLESLFN
jgi:phage tail sheath protein FI